MSNITHEEFVDILQDILHEESVGELLTIPGIYEILSEEFNNEVLERYESEKDRCCPLYNICNENDTDKPPYNICPLVKKEIEENYDFYCDDLENDEMELIKTFIKENNL